MVFSPSNKIAKMQERHSNRLLYFKELSVTSKNYFIPYIQKWHKIESGMKVLEIGCGEGGNLLPFSETGCFVTGVDMSGCRIEEARDFFDTCGAKGEFIAEDIFKLKDLEHKYDIIICHDVLEHLDDKQVFLSKIGKYLNDGGIVFMSFPAWHMPFGGHQQICRNRVLSHMPFVHLLPATLYKAVIKMFGESDTCVNELLDIKRTRITIERFEKYVKKTDLSIRDRLLWFINPHYKVKFGLKPRRLVCPFSSIPYLRNFMSSSCFYILSR